jgi:hypothetical protein
MSANDVPLVLSVMYFFNIITNRYDGKCGEKNDFEILSSVSPHFCQQCLGLLTAGQSDSGLQQEIPMPTSLGARQCAADSG